MQDHCKTSFTLFKPIVIDCLQRLKYRRIKKNQGESRIFKFEEVLVSNTKLIICIWFDFRFEKFVEWHFAFLKPLAHECGYMKIKINKKIVMRIGENRMQIEHGQIEPNREQIKQAKD